MLSRDEIIARSKRLYPNYPVDPYTGTLNTPIEKAESRYTNDASGGGWDQFFGQLQKQQEAAEAQGKTFKVGWGGFGNEAAAADSAARGAAAMPRRVQAPAYEGSLNPADLNPLEEQDAKYAAMNRAASDEVDRQKAIKLAQDEAADRLQQKDIDNLTTAYQNRVLDTTLAPPESPTTVTRTPGAAGQPDTITMRPAASQTDWKARLLSAIPGHLRPGIEETLQKMDLEKEAVQAKAELERAQAGAANPFGLQQGGSSGGAAAAGTGPTGAEFLKTLPPAIGKQVQAYAEGRLPFPTGFALKAPYFQQMLQAVGQYDPTFDAVNYNARNKLYSDLTSTNGKGGQTIAALNTAVQHLGRLSDLVETLGNTNYRVLNAPANFIEKELGSTKVTNFNVVQPQAMKEIERLWRSTGGSQKDIDELQASVSPNMGIQQQREALGNFADLIRGKLEPLEEQRDKGLGPNAAQRVQILHDKSRPVLAQVYQRAGMNVPPSIAAPTAESTQQQPIPGIEGGMAEFRNGKWIRVK